MRAARLGEAVLALWPKVPKALLGELTAWPQADTKALPINRRKRKAISKAKKVLLHLFAGDSRREIERRASDKGFEVLSIGEQEDITAGQTFRYVLQLAAEGQLDSIWAAPPCGTNSLCRFLQPGPPPLRGRNGESRWGLSGLSVTDQQKVRVSDEMYLRCLIIMLVSAEGRKRTCRPPTWSLAENPQDPDEYLALDAPLRQKAAETGGLPSWFATEEFQTASRLLGMKVYAGDQGPYGHAKRKPTGWASTRQLPPLHKGLGMGEEPKAGNEKGGSGMSWPSRAWAKWSPGMIDLLVQLLDDADSKDQLCKAEINWTAHVASGHWPPHRRCRVCIAASARHRAHRRVSSPASWVLSLDVVGPLKKANDETERDLRYALVGCFVVPIDGSGRPVLAPEQQQAVVEDQQSPDDESRDIGIDLGLLAEDEDEAGDEDPAPPGFAEAMERCQQDASNLSKEELECSVPGLVWKEIPFIQLLRRKTPAAVAQGASRMISDIRELGLPLQRLHTDCGTEFVSTSFRGLAARQDLRHTTTAPEEHSSNGRVEACVGRVKSLKRVNLRETGDDPTLWPLAMRAAVAAMRHHSLKGLGFPVPNMVPYGAKVQVLTRSWLRRRKQEWHMKAKQATVLSPAALVKLGYVVQVGKQLAVVTKLFQGEDPKISVSVDSAADEAPVAHSVGPESRITGKSTVPDMHARPDPSTRYREKAPAPGRTPVASKVQSVDAKQAEDAVAELLAMQDPFNMAKAVEFIAQSSYVRGSPKPAGNLARVKEGMHYVFGVFRHGGVVGLTNNCKLYPGMAKLLAAIAREQAPQATYTTAILSANAYVPPHRDSTNLPSSISYWIPLTTPRSGGRLWTQVQQGDTLAGVPMTVQVKGQAVVGQLHDKHKPVAFNPLAWHGVEPWDMKHPRIVILLYTTNCLPNLSPQHQDYLQKLGFVVPNDKGGDPFGRGFCW